MKTSLAFTANQHHVFQSEGGSGSEAVAGCRNMACTYTHAHRGMTVAMFLFTALIIAHVILQPASAKPDNLRVITDANWEDILTGEWMIEL